MTYIFKTGGTGLTMDEEESFTVIKDDLKTSQGKKLIVVLVNLKTKNEAVETRFLDGKYWPGYEKSGEDLMPPEPKVIGSVWGVILYDSLHSISFPEMFFNNRETAVEKAMQLKSHWIARFDTYDDPEHTVKVEVENVK